MYELQTDKQTFMKIYLIFHVILLNHIASDFLLNQRQKLQELVIIKNNKRF